MTTIFSILSLAWSLQGGVNPTLATVNVYDGKFRAETISTAYWNVTGELQIPVFSGIKGDVDGLYVNGIYQNNFIPSPNSVSFRPLVDTFTVGAGLRWDGITIGAEHVCIHPLVTLRNEFMLQYVFGGFDKIFIKMEGKL